MVGGTQLRDVLRVEAPGVSAADVGWSWVAEQQRQLGATEAVKLIERRLPNSRVVMPYWREMSAARSGWVSGGRVTASPEDLRLLQMVELVYRAIPGSCGSEWYSETQGEVIWVEAEDQRAVWDRVNKVEEFRGLGGRNMYWKCWALLMSEGRVQGDIGRGPREGTWWQETVDLRVVLGMRRVGGADRQECGVLPAVREPVRASGVLPAVRATGGRREGGVVEVVVGWMAGAQSGARAAEERGLEYVGLDIRRDVYSVLSGGWVRNVAIDLLSATEEGVWAAVRTEVRGRGLRGRVVLRFLEGGPCCRTFSKMDQVNAERRCNYREHSVWERPPVRGRGKYTKAAVEGDKGVQRFRAFAVWAEGRGGLWGWMMENPVGLLQYRPFAQEGVWGSRVVRRMQVDLCAYGHYYMKPTHIWTTVRGWRPRGERAEGNGKCGQKCRMGSWVGGRWKHRFGIGVESTRARGGVGRREAKQAIPHLLHREILGAAMGQ